MNWARFNKAIIWSLGITILCILLLILWTNPYRNIPFMDASDDLLFDTNQRYLYPSIANDLRFDSAVFGTSSIRLLNPSELNQDIGGNFAELAMNSATAYEQSELSRLFISSRKNAPLKTIIWGIDGEWCKIEDNYQKYTFRPFPPWMYDNNPWNEMLYLFNGKTLEIAARAARYKLGLSDKFKYDTNGYADFLPPIAEYDLKKVQDGIYRGALPTIHAPINPPVVLGINEIENWQYATHSLLVDQLSKMPKATTKVILFVPYHQFFQAVPGSKKATRFDECKRRIKSIAQNYENTFVLDFMIKSDITLNDKNYWDPLHYKVEIASILSVQIGEFLSKQNTSNRDYKVLYDSRINK